MNKLTTSAPISLEIRASGQELEDQIRTFREQPMLVRMFDANPDPFLVLNQYRQIVFANQAFVALVGQMERSVIYGLRPGEALHCAHATDEPAGCGASEFCSTCGAAKAIAGSLAGKEQIEECLILTESNNALNLQVWAQPLPLEEPFTTFAVKDISHEKQRRVLERIFFHDLMNVAGAIKGYSELMKDLSPEDLTYVREAFGRLADRLTHEISVQRELLDAENNELFVEPVTINSHDLLAMVADTYREHNAAIEKRIRLDPQAQAITFTSDETLLSRVLGNMTKNALEACQPGQMVTLNCYAAGDRVTFTVHNPTFMPPKVQLQVFQRSFSTKGRGRGLGTYSMKLLTERYLHGQISFTTSEEAGTTFTVTYPPVLGEG